jgi:hypothetical protein
MIWNDKPNCQVSRILMNTRPILSDSSENDPKGKLCKYLISIVASVLLQLGCPLVLHNKSRRLILKIFAKIVK